MSTSYIGELVKRFESGSRGSSSLGSCGNDWGISCGSYQLTLRWGNCVRFLKKYFPEESKSLYFNNRKRDLVQSCWPGKEYCSSPQEVKEIWNKCLDKVGKDKFFSYEHAHIASTYYLRVKPLVKPLIDLDKTSRAFQECFWSWSVHRGVGGAVQEFKEALNGKKPNDLDFEELFDLLYDKRYQETGFSRYKKGVASSEREVLRKFITINGVGVKEIASPYKLGDVQVAEVKPVANKKPNKKPNKDLAMLVKVTSSNGLNVREQATSKSSKVSALSLGDQVTVTKYDANKKWGYVNSLKGWIYLAYTKAI